MSLLVIGRITTKTGPHMVREIPWPYRNWQIFRIQRNTTPRNCWISGKNASNSFFFSTQKQPCLRVICDIAKQGPCVCVLYPRLDIVSDARFFANVFRPSSQRPQRVESEPPQVSQLCVAHLKRPCSGACNREEACGRSTTPSALQS